MIKDRIEALLQKFVACAVCLHIPKCCISPMGFSTNSPFRLRLHDSYLHYYGAYATIVPGVRPYGSKVCERRVSRTHTHNLLFYSFF